MAKKSTNPADAYRKAQRKKELKKHKAERTKARDFALVKKDTKDLEDDIAKLESVSESVVADKTRLAELKAELAKINKKKADYVEEHPEQRKLVYRTRGAQDDDENKEVVVQKKRNMFNKHGLPRHPERSIYYDPVMNPFGVAPPGMPYMERPLRPDEVASDAEEDGEDEDEDVVMPEGPPPGPSTGNESNIDSDDDIPMPEGPPPGASPLSPQQTYPFPPFPPTGISSTLTPPPFGFPTNIPPPPSFFVGQVLPPPPPGFMAPQMPPPPPGFFPRQNQSSMQDPLSSIPHQTFQAYRPPAHPSLPPKPTVNSPVNTANTEAATISAAPQLRNFKKEATAFVPSVMKRKKPAAAGSSKVNAAPPLDADSATVGPVRPDLLGTLKGQFGLAPAAPPAKNTSTAKDDYAKFRKEMGDILGPPS